MSLGFSLGGVTDLASTAIDAGSEFVANSGGGGDLFSSAANFAGDAFGWINKNPESANLLGGVAMGIGQAYSASKDREMQRDLQRERLEAQQIAPGDMPAGYGGYRDKISEGLISNGLIASQQEGK